MGKRLKKKAARNSLKEKEKDKEKEKEKEKEKRLEAQSPVIADDDDAGCASQKESKGCAHIEKGVDLALVSSKIESANSTACLSCREAANQRKSRKPKSHHKPPIWVCLQCAVFSCGGLSLPNSPQTHALRHLRLTCHPLVIQLHHPFSIWCFPCSSLLPKALFPDLVTLLKNKTQPQPQPQPQSQPSSVGVDDIWFGGASVVTQLKSAVANGNGNDCYAVRGLVNLGNTCFFNSVLQNLLAMDTLRDFLLNFEGSMGPLMTSLKKIFVETSLDSGPRNVINPKPLFGSVCAKAPQFRGYQQQDSHELLRCLLDGLSSEDLHAKKLRTSAANGHFRATFVDAIFGGQTSSTVCCVECGHSSVVYEPFLDLSLPVPTKKTPSKKPQLMPRTKKKLPPKRGGKIRPKLKNGDIGPALTSFNTSTNNQFCSGLKSDSLGCDSSANVAEPDIVVHENAMPQGSNSTESGCTAAQDPQNVSLDADGESWLKDNKPVFQADSAQEADCFAWMDYLEPVSMPEVPNLVVENDNFSVPRDLESDDDNHDTVYMENTARPSGEDSLYQESGVEGDTHDGLSVPDMSKSGGEVCVYPEDVNLKSECVVNGWDDECPPQVQDNGWGDECPPQVQDNGWGDECPPQVQENEILLLTYKEDGVIEGEEIKTDGQGIFDGEDTMGFDGLGNLFDEPAAIEEGVNSMQVSEHVGNGFLVGNNTESDPDEVDDTDSPVSVESCLASFVKPELLSGEHAWHCENCSKLLKEERQRMIMNLGDVSNDECSSSEVVQVTSNPSQDSSTDLLLNHNSCSSATNYVDARQTNGLSPNLQPEEETSCTSQSVDLNASDEVCLDSKSLGSQVERPSGPNEQQESGEDKEEKEEDLKCVKVMRDATKRILISKIPQILTIHLKRFAQDACGRLSKLNGHVGFKEYINLGHYMDSRSKEGRENCTYRLVGVVEHSGSMRGGHYVAYVRGHRRRGKSEENSQLVWYHASDAYVRETTLEEVLRCEAYLLFYEKVKP